MTASLPHNRYYAVFLCPGILHKISVFPYSHAARFTASLPKQLFSHDQPQIFDLLLLLLAADKRVDARGVDARVPKQVRQVGDILLRLIICDGKQVAEVVREYLLPADVGLFAERFHVVADVTPVDRLSASGHKNTVPRDPALSDVSAQLPAERRGQQHCPLFSFGTDPCAPGLQ